MITLENRLTVPGTVLGSMIEHATASGGRECCGALLGTTVEGTRLIERAAGIPNEASDPHRAYLIDCDAFRRIEREAHADGLRIVGFYHSHPDGSTRPSAADLELAWPWYSYVIIDPRQRTATAWRLRADRAAFDADELVTVA